MLDKVGIPMETLATAPRRSRSNRVRWVGWAGLVRWAVLLGLAKKERRGSLVTKSIGGSWLVPLIVVAYCTCLLFASGRTPHQIFGS